MAKTPNAVIVSGPHKGRTIYLSEPGLSVSWEDPARPGVLCRYRSNDGDDPVEGMTPLHYFGEGTRSA